MEVKVEALVLKTVDYGDNDKIVTLFSLQFGKIIARAKGVKNNKAALKFSVQPFALCEYILFKKGERYTIIQATLIDAFYEIRLDIHKLYAASAITSILNSILYENSLYIELFLFTIQTLKELTVEEDKPIFISFFLKALQSAGYALEVDNCAVCHSILSGIVNIDCANGLFYCRECGNGLGVRPTTLEVLKRALGKKYKVDDCTSQAELRAIQLLYHYFYQQTACLSPVVESYIHLIQQPEEIDL